MLEQLGMLGKLRLALEEILLVAQLGMLERLEMLALVDLVEPAEVAVLEQ